MGKRVRYVTTPPYTSSRKNSSKSSTTSTKSSLLTPYSCAASRHLKSLAVGVQLLQEVVPIARFPTASRRFFMYAST
ncbi:MAG: hypothetical protein ACO2PM_15310 [Pyrobaculum sp.]